MKNPCKDMIFLNFRKPYSRHKYLLLLLLLWLPVALVILPIIWKQCRIHIFPINSYLNCTTIEDGIIIKYLKKSYNLPLVPWDNTNKENHKEKVFYFTNWARKGIIQWLKTVPYTTCKIIYCFLEDCPSEFKLKAAPARSRCCSSRTAASLCPAGAEPT